MQGFNVGTEEIMVIAVASHEARRRMSVEKDVVAEGLRRNGMLVWKPDPITGKIQDCDTL